jgi:hypothetical protein
MMLSIGLTVIRAFKGADFQTEILEAIDCTSGIALAISQQSVFW